jgi:CBS domain-containing protein
MTTHPSVVSRSNTIAEAACVMRDRRIRMLPVIDDLCLRNLVGVITDDDIVTRCVAGGHGSESRVGMHMTSDALASVSADAYVGEVVTIMEQRGLSRLPVTDADGRVIGVVTLSDLAARIDPVDPHIIEQVEHSISAAHLMAVR